MSDVPTSPIEDESALAANRLKWLLPLAVTLVTGVAFFSCLRNGFAWDDDEVIVHNEHIQSLTAANLGWMFTTTDTGVYQPLAWLSLAVDYHVWGKNAAWGFHLTSVLLHMGAAIAFYLVARRLLAAAFSSARDPDARGGRVVPVWTGTDPGLSWAAAAAAVVFALHPLRVESVAWAAERRDVLGGLLLLLAVLCYLRFVAIPLGAPGRRRWYTGVVVLYALSLMSGPTGVMLPAVLAVLDVYPLRRIQPKDGTWRGATTERVLLEKVPPLLLALVAGLVAISGQAQAGAMTGMNTYSVLERIIVAVAGIGFYFVKTLLPIGLSPMYELPYFLVMIRWQLLLHLFVAVGVTVAAVRLRRRFPGPATVWLCYVVTLLPMLGFVQAGVQMAADRYSYLPSLSLSMAVGGVVLAWWRRSKDRPMAIVRRPAIVVILLAAALAPLTWRQCTFWVHDIWLWIRAVNVYPRSAVSWYELGAAWDRKPGARANAIQAYRGAVTARADYVLAWQNLGNALLMDGKDAEAIGAYREALKYDPDQVYVLSNMSLALIRLGRFDEAVERAREAVAAAPDYAVASNTLGMALRKQYETKRDPRLLDEALVAFHKAVEADPHYANAYEGLFGSLMSQGRYGEAVDVLRDGLKHMPDDLKLANNLAWILATCQRDDVRDGEEALKWAKFVCQETKYKTHSFLDTLAAAYAEVGDFEKAVQAIQLAIDLVSDEDQKMASRYRGRRQEYVSRRPLRRTSY